MKKQEISVIIAERDPTTAQRLVSLSTRMGLRAFAFNTGKEALVAAQELKGKIFIAESGLADMDAGSFLTEVRSWKNGHTVVVMVDENDAAGKGEILRQGAYELIGKPVKPEAYRLMMQRILEKDEMCQKIKTLKRLYRFFLIMIPIMVTAGMLLAVV